MRHALLSRSIAHRIHLVFHQCNQRRNHDGGTVAYHGGQLVAKRLAATRRHNHKRIMPLQDTVNDSLLVALEIVKAENLL